MSKRAWSSDHIVRLIVFLGFTLLLLLAVFSASNSGNEEAKQKAECGNAEQYCGQKASNTWWWEAIEPFTLPKDSAAQWLMMVASFLAVIVSGVAVYWVKMTYNATVIMTEDTRKMAADQNTIGRAQTRAYVSIKEGEMRETSEYGVGRVPFQRVFLMNSGASPALNMRTSGVLLVADSTLEEVGLSDGIEAAFQGGESAMDLPSSETVPGRIYANFRMDEAIMLSLGEYPPSKRLFVIGKVSYNDVFGEAHTSRFSFRNNSYIDTATGERKFQWLRTPTGNESD